MGDKRGGEQRGRWEEIGGVEPQEKRRAIEAPPRGQGGGYQQTYHHNPVFNQFIRRVYPEGSYSPGMGPVPLITCPPGGGGCAGVAGGFQGSLSMMQCPPPWPAGLSSQVPPGNHQRQEEYRQVPPPTCLLESNQQQQFTLDCDMRNPPPSTRMSMMQSQHQASQAPGGSLEPPGGVSGGGLDPAALGSPQRRSRWDLPPSSPPITVLDGESITKKDGNNGMVASSSSSGFKPFKLNPQASSGKVLIGKRRGGGKALPTGVIKRPSSPSKIALKTAPGQDSSTQQPPPTWSRYLAEVEQYKSHICSDPNPNRSLVK